MTRKGKVLVAVSVFLLLGLMSVLWVGSAEIRSLKEPRFEVGKHAGAAVCSECHQEIFAQWSTRSRHARATSGKHFLEFRNKVRENVLINALMGEKSCYACHGSRELNEGVTCETCHGLLDNSAPVMGVHATKFAPRLVTLRSEGYCATCHELPEAMTPHSEWQRSAAAEQGMTCQKCHMPAGADGLPYHGFDSVVLDGDIYQGDLVIRDVVLDYPNLKVSVENLISGHGVPAGGPSRVLALELTLSDAEGRVLHEMNVLFRKKFDLMPIAGLMPLTLVEDTHLESGEVRRLVLTLPPNIADKIAGVGLLLRFYEVSDEYQGDISKAHWISEPIVVKEIRFAGTEASK
jgi:hypothetical protein